jgi:hypothetical protein
VEPLLIRNRYFGRYVKTLDHIIGFSTAPTYPLEKIEDGGLLRLSASQHLFGFNRGVDSPVNQAEFIDTSFAKDHQGNQTSSGPQPYVSSMGAPVGV